MSCARCLSREPEYDINRGQHPYPCLMNAYHETRLRTDVVPLEVFLRTRIMPAIVPRRTLAGRFGQRCQARLVHGQP